MDLLGPLGLTLALCGGALIGLPFLDPKDNRARTALFVICIVLTWRYILWRFTDTLPPLALRFESLYAWGFSVTEALACLGWTFGFINLSRTKSRSDEATRQRTWLAASKHLPRIDVLITTYNEEEQILLRSIVGALGIDFPEVRVWVLDDGRRPWLEQLCKEKGVNYVTRSTNAHAKAGNINHALDILHDEPDPPEFVAVFDADFVAHRDFLWRTVPLFHDARVGLVQTPQHFFNRDPIQANLIVGHVWPDEQRFFFDHVLASKDAWGGAFCCGTSSVIRVSALESCGGFPTDSVTEDFLLTLRLDHLGWRTVYLNEPLSVGLAPEGMKEYVTQRGRWCLGLMQILRSPLGPLSTGRLSLPYRIGLIDAFLYWSAGFLFKLLCLLAPIVYWFTGVTVGTANVSAVIAHFLPYYIAVMVTLYWITGGLIQPVLTDVSHVLTMPAALKSTVIGLLRPRGHSFKVTPKGGSRKRLLVQWRRGAGFGLILGLTVLGMLYASLADYTPERQEAGSTAVVLFWSVYNIVVLLLAMAVCVEFPRFRGEERIASSERVEVSFGSFMFTARLSDISVTGAQVRAPSPADPGDFVSLKLQDVGEVEARITRPTADGFAVEFIETDALRDALIRKIYCSPEARSSVNVSGRRLLNALVVRTFR
jgi:cellulose synthase/poly-beta-1,6-N-acetylglucosamine synthase-like glycosyltransferase